MSDAPSYIDPTKGPEQIEDGAEIRDSVLIFATAMEHVLQRNDHKGGWQEKDPHWLFEKLIEEVGEVGAAMAEGKPGLVKTEVIDVANVAMMLFERAKSVIPWGVPK